MLNSSLIISEKPLKLKITELTENQATLVLPDDQKIIIHPKSLPQGSVLGDYIYLNLLSEEQLSSDKQAVAKAVLEEILKK